MKIKFNDSEQIYNVTAVIMRGNIVILVGGELPQDNTSGFKMIRNTEEDYSDFKYKFNVLTEFENVIMFSNNKDMIETEDNQASEYYQEPDPNAKYEEVIDPLTNEELTEAVANLMYETSMMQLGMEV